ncbi:ABC transporter permease [Phytomonospora endophytica]|uniref:Transport permease protein n=1 Tax=Phytomonospora endophytica TaxID=714109 RepID=A0A841FI60_9ACTN|nr:ABC transporter permease [Phytomonospora endophytica]MBB6032807.1 ABC-2 type transport system permease protein [Phytomonospora endophytica]GIG66044.1 transport permease protein [Phytomonospora endophytica]
MSIRITAATTARILRQLAGDRRTIALILLVPTLLLTLLRYVMDSAPMIFDRVGLVMLGVFPFISMFLVTSVAMLRERTSGTLERMLTTPLHKLDLLLGYGIAFALAAAVQAGLAATTSYWLLGLDTAGSPWLIGGLAVANAVLGVAVGLLLSAFATSEFQAVQFMPAVVLPQMLLCGLIWPREEMAGWLQGASEVMPLTYAVEALTEVGAHTSPTNTMWLDLAVVLGVALLALILGAATLRRRTP